MTHVRIPRALHPVAWWVWAGGLAMAASRTTNPLLLALILAVAGVVVAARRTDAPWARAFRSYLALGLVVVAIRVVFRIVLAGGEDGGHVLFTMPHLPTPGWMAGVRAGGPVSAESVVAALYDGARLATILACVGAANSLANPKRALASLPGALYEIGVACVVALTAAPQLVESAQRVRRAQRLRHTSGRGLGALPALAGPVVHDALTRSLLLAAAMDCRGYGSVAPESRRARRVAAISGVAAVAALSAGLYGLLDPTVVPALGPVALAAGIVLAVAALAAGSRRARRTRYRPDPWKLPEWVVSATGVVVATVFFLPVVAHSGALDPSVYPLAWPTLPLLPTAALALALLPAVVAPPPPVGRPAHRREPVDVRSQQPAPEPRRTASVGASR